MTEQNPVGQVPFSSILGHGACIACLKGDTTTGLVLFGSREWQAACMTVMGIPIDQAIAIVETANDNQQAAVRVCARCAKRGRMTVGPIGSEAIPAYSEIAFFKPDEQPA